VDKPILIALYGARAEKDMMRDFIQKWLTKSDSALSAVIADVVAIDDIELAESLDALTVKLKSAERAEGEPLEDDKFDVVIREVVYHAAALMMGEIRRNGVLSIKRGHPLPWRIL
jgi:hypothetical protein